MSRGTRAHETKSVQGHRQETAALSNDGPYTLFSFAGRRIKFKAPPCLRRYVRVKKWDDGYIEVDADYGKAVGTIEDYIDLRPILKCLMISPDEFIKPIKRVEVRHA